MPSLIRSISSLTCSRLAVSPVVSSSTRFSSPAWTGGETYQPMGPYFQPSSEYSRARPIPALPAPKRKQPSSTCQGPTDLFTTDANVLLHSVHLVQISCCILYTWCKCPSAFCTTGANVPLHSVQLVLLSLWVCILWRCCYCLAVSLLVSSCIVFNKSKCLLVVWVTGIIFLPLNNFFSDVVFFLFSMCVSLDYTG